MSRFEFMDVLHGLVSHACPDVLSIMCLNLGCGRTVVCGASFQAAIDAAIRIIAVANSKSFIEIVGCLRNKVVSF